MHLVDTHCHLDYLENKLVKEIVQDALNDDVKNIVTIAVSPDNQVTVAEIAKEFDGVFCTQGVHPHDAKLFDENCAMIMLDNLKDSSNKVVAIGEIGLDYHYNHSPKDIQKDVFEKQLQMSIDNELPVVIHTREADNDIKSILNNFKSSLKYGGIVHCFSSDLTMANFVIECGLKIGITGVVTFPKAHILQEVVKEISLEHIVLETDAPYLTPIPFRDKQNFPSYVPYIAKKVSQIKNCSVDEVAEVTTKNAQQLFKL